VAAGAAAEMVEVAGGVEVEEWIDRWMLVWRWERLLKTALIFGGQK